MGLLLPPFLAWWLIGQRHASVALSLLGVAAVPMLIWAGSLGAKIGPRSVGPCMSAI